MCPYLCWVWNFTNTWTMPLFIDLHELDAFSSIDEIKNAHLLDLAVQQKHNVRYINYYVNPQAGKIFCVVEAPDKESCAAVHREAHGLMACNIIQVEGGYYDLIMGLQRTDVDGLNFHEDGNIDHGIRSILYISTIASTQGDYGDAALASDLHHEYVTELERALKTYGGRGMPGSGNETIAAFTSGQSAVQCGLFLQERLLLLNGRIKKQGICFETIIVLGAGDPVTSSSEFFGDTLRLTRRLAHLGSNGDIILSSEFHENSRPAIPKNRKQVKATSVLDERFINNLMEVAEEKIVVDSFNIGMLCHSLGISRPQLYRKIHALFGMAPNHLVSELRLKKSVSLLNKKFGNISEVAYRVGYSNPSYFSKCFHDRFGVLPSKYSTVCIF